ncbi:54S ribosomal protein L23, mitochondrial [Podochytrium sp. JEL0797]|nr:54S ribosomal protein L23, mitochondrial [Podochytrium sp. JEL0797]
MASNSLAMRGRVWHLVDARDRTLGTLAQRVSIALRGKYKPIFTPSDDVGDYVVVINARHAKLTAKKDEQKLYRWHSRWVGGLTELTHAEFSKDHPNGPLKKAVYGMLPKNNLRKTFFNRLYVFSDADHPFAQNIMRDYEADAKIASLANAAAAEAGSGEATHVASDKA